MIKKEGQVSRKIVNEDRIAICPHLGCRHLEKVKPLKFGFLGFRKYPKCSKHKFPLVFVDEFIENFFHAVNACLFDRSSLPPEDLISLIKTRTPDGLKAFLNGWMYCNPIGRGAQIVSNYMDGLSRGYMKLLSRKQRKALENEKRLKISLHMLRLGLKKIGEEYAAFLQKLREKSEMIHDLRELHPLSDDVTKLLKMWLKGHLKEIHVVGGKYNSEFPIESEALSMYKEQYDKILHAGTCALLLGKPPTIVNKGVSPFELFSAYYDFLKAGLCKELTREKMKSILEKSQEFLNINEEEILNIQNDGERNLYSKSDDMRDKEHRFGRKDYENINSSNISIPNFRQKVINCLKTLNSLIDGTTEQIEITRLKSLEILDKFISRAKDNEFTISSTADPNVIATSIIYTAIISHENMPEIKMYQIAKLGGIESTKITYYYNRYFRALYPRKKCDLSVYKLTAIKLVFSLYFFEILMDMDVKFSDLIHPLKEKILKNINLPKKLTRDNIRELQEIATNHPDIFTKYFSDLFNIVKHLIILTTVFRKIGASIKIMPIIRMLEKKGITLSQGHYGFHRSVTEIYDFLRQNYPKFFPKRVERENIPKKERPKRRRQIKRIVGTKIKLYVIKNIYNGKYFKKGKISCPKCLKEGLSTDIIRIKALEFHHSSEEKENKFTSENLYQLFVNDQLNPHFLEDLIKLMESEKVELLCNNHHNLLHHKYYLYFRYLINWDNIFSYSAEVIRMLIRVSVNNFHETKDLSIEEKKEIRRYIRIKFKKRYIIEIFYGKYCPTCGKFNTKDHLTAYQFNHYDRDTKTIDTYATFKNNSCSKIVEILEREKGGYICGNCHTVIHYDKYIPFLDKIFEDDNTIKKILDDYNNVCTNFSLIYSKNSIGNPLKISKNLYGSFKNYLTAIYEISNSGRKVTHSTLSEYMGLAIPSIYYFFKRRNNLVSKYVDIEVGKSGWKGEETKYFLNEKGRELISLLNHFKDYFGSIQ